MPAKLLNAHLELYKIGFQVHFDGMTRLVPRRRYVACQFPAEIKEKLKFIKGQDGFATLLSLEKEVIPEAILQFWPAPPGKDGDENAGAGRFHVGLMVPRRKLVYGYDEPIDGMNAALLMTQLRKSSFHGPDTIGAQFYFKDSLGYYTQNPFLKVVWSKAAYGFVEQRRLQNRFPKLTEYIADGQVGFSLYPPVEPKRKTVTNDDAWWAPAPMVFKPSPYTFQWSGFQDAAAVPSPGPYSVPAKMGPSPSEAEKIIQVDKPLSKHGRLIIFNSEEGIGE